MRRDDALCQMWLDSEIYPDLTYIWCYVSGQVIYPVLQDYGRAIDRLAWEH